MNFLLLSVLLILLLIVGMASAYFLGHSLSLGLIAGLALGLPPWLVYFLSDRGTAMQTAKFIILLLIIVLSILSTQQVLWPLLNAELAMGRVQNIGILVLGSVGLYILYLLMIRSDAFSEEQTLNKKLSILFSGPSLLLSLAMAIILMTFALLSLYYIQAQYPEIEFLSKRMMERGIIPPITLMLFFWGLLILFNKAYMLYRENLALKGMHADSRSILQQSYYQNLQTSGSTQIDAYINFLWNESDNFYIIPRYINWAIPILGFIGTVLGISLAADGIQRIIGSQQGLARMSNEMGEAISPLGIAFDTTLVALSLSIVLALVQLIMQRWENKFMSEHEHQLRNTPINQL